MASTPSLRIVKQISHHGSTRTWSNRYHFNGGTPADATHWHTLMDNVTAAEKAAMNNDYQIVEAIGYAAGSDVPVASKTYTLSGTWSQGGNDHSCPSDCAAVLRWSTSARSSKNHPVYLYNYFHHVFYDNTHSAPDALAPDMATVIATYAAAWISGFSDGTITAVRAGPNGATATGSLVLPWISHRDFPN